MLEVTTPATAHDLTSLATVKTDLGISCTDSDSVLADLIRRASDAIATACNRTFGTETIRQTFRPLRPSPDLILARFPLVSVSSITENDAPLTSGEYEVSPGDGLLRRLTPKRHYQCWEAGVVVVEYSAGWVLPGQVGRTLPADIEAAALAMIRQAWFARGRDPAMRSYDSPDVESMSFFDPDKLMPGHGVAAYRRSDFA